MRADAIWIILLVLSVTGQAAEDPYGPLYTPKVSGSKVSNGIRIESGEKGNAFSFDLAGENILPTAANELIWDVNGIRVQLLCASRRKVLPPGSSEIEMLESFRQSESAGLASPAGTSVEKMGNASGGTVLYWVSAQTNGLWRASAAALNGDHLILLVGAALRPDQEPKVRNCLTRSLLSVKRNVAGGRHAVPQTEELGASLQQMLETPSAFIGEPYLAVLNQRLMTPVDSRVPKVIPVDPVTQMELLRFLLAVGPKSLPIQLSVFDGELAHSINVHTFDAEANQYQYWDPWGEGSFLQSTKNRAGVNAVPDPKERRMWLVAANELERVVYAIIQPQKDVLDVLRLCTLLAGPPENAILEYRNLRLQGTNESRISAEQLRAVQQYLESRDHLPGAATLFGLRLALDPSVATAAGQIAEKLEAAKRHDLVKLLAPAPEPPPWPPMLKIGLDAAKQSDFFEFFNLDQVASNNEQEGSAAVTFRPRKSSAFRDLVELKALVQRDVVTAWRLYLARSFLTDSEQSFFAADLAKSFLTFAVPAASADPVGDLTKEIWTWSRSGRRYVSVPGAARPTKLPAIPSPGYLAYLGLRPHYEQALSGGRLRLLTVNDARGASLLIEVETTQ
jgi:hypothetical protein